jgi:hypothetical protein
VLLATELVKIVDALDCAAFYWSATASLRHMRIRLHLRVQPSRGSPRRWKPGSAGLDRRPAQVWPHPPLPAGHHRYSARMRKWELPDRAGQ